MCEYCGCRSLRSIEELTREHEAALEHIGKEQDGLFPAALTRLGSDDWEAVEAVRRRVGSALHAAEQGPSAD